MAMSRGRCTAVAPAPTCMWFTPNTRAEVGRLVRGENDLHGAVGFQRGRRGVEFRDEPLRSRVVAEHPGLH